MENLTDEELMRLVRDGNLDMMSKLFDRYHIQIYNFSLQMTRDKEISKDITQDTFYKAIKYRESYKMTRFSSWIYTIAKNLCNDHFRIQQKKEDQLNAIQKSDIHPESTHESPRDYERLNMALNSLNNNDKELIIMSRFQGLKYQEIADITNSTPGAIKTKMHRAMQKLKNYYFINCMYHEL